MKFDFSTAIAGLVVGIPSFFLGWLTLRRGNRVDRATAQQAVVAARGSEVSQVIDGLNRLVDNLQEDNRIWRQSLESVSHRLSACITEREELQRKLNDLTD